MEQRLCIGIPRIFRLSRNLPLLPFLLERFVELLTKRLECFLELVPDDVDLRVVGDGSDLGGGCSTMGTLSGGGNMVISIGEKCLLGANAGTGIPLGDRCTIEAGLYLTAGTKILVLDDKKEIVDTVKGRDLAGKSD